MTNKLIDFCKPSLKGSETFGVKTGQLDFSNTEKI